jgi:hypothetical protein
VHDAVHYRRGLNRQSIVALSVTICRIALILEVNPDVYSMVPVNALDSLRACVTIETARLFDDLI